MSLTNDQGGADPAEQGLIQQPTTVGTEAELYVVMLRALGQLGSRHWLYKRYSDYYNGAHRLVFATEKFRNAFGRLFREFAANLCPAVVDALADRLTLQEFDIDDDGDEDTAAADAEKGDDEKVKQRVEEIVEYNRLDRLFGEVHQEAATSGDAFVLVWPDATGEPRFYPQKAAQFTVCYDEEDPTLIVWAAKAWKTHDKRFRLNLYLPDRTLKFITTEKTDGLPEKPDKFAPFSPPDGGGDEVPNPYGRVPVFHFANNGSVGCLGKSELKDVLPIQDALNKSILDMMVAMEFCALPQRYATGLELEYDLETGEAKQPWDPGVDRMWSTPSKDVSFGEFKAADLTHFLAAADAFRMDICRITGTPLHHFMLGGGNPPSGEALEALEQRLIKKALDRQVAFGDTWEDAMQFALRVAGQEGADLKAVWADPAPKSELEHSQALVNKQTIGVSQKQLFREMGYSDELIERMVDEKQEQDQLAAENALKQFNAGAGIPPQGGRNSGPQGARRGSGPGAGGAAGSRGGGAGGGNSPGPAAGTGGANGRSAG